MFPCSHVPSPWSLKEPDTTEQLSIQKDKVMLIENENLGPWNESIGVYTFDYISSTFIGQE